VASRWREGAQLRGLKYLLAAVVFHRRKRAEKIARDPHVEALSGSPETYAQKSLTTTDICRFPPGDNYTSWGKHQVLYVQSWRVEILMTRG